MSTHSHVDATVLASTRSDVGKRLNVASLVRAIVIILLGAFALCGTFMLPDSSSATGMALLVAGIALLFYGLFTLLAKSKKVVYLPTGTTIKAFSFYFDLKHLDTLKRLLQERDFEKVAAIQGGQSGNVRMDVLLSDCNRFAAAQLFQFVPYNYQPVCDTTCMTDDEAGQFSTFVRSLQHHVNNSL
jgi:hypothetical protein